jgi:hypothetical protein
MNNNEDFQKLITKANEAKRDNKLDLSRDEDLSIAIMNLVSIEEHFFFTAAKTGDNKHFTLLNQVREMRKNLLAKIVKNPEGEEWCISKHLLAASMRLMEVGTKELNKGNQTAAEDFFQKSYELYSLFWGINLKIIDTSNIQKIDDQALNKKDTEKKGFMGTLGSLVKKLVDCCRE